MTQLLSILNTTAWLLWRDAFTLRKNIINSFIDSIIMPIAFIIIGGYIFPHMGLSNDYGAFMVVGSTVMMIQNSCMWISAMPMVADIASERSISYELVLPLPSWLLMVKTALGFALSSLVCTLLTIPIGKLLLLDRFNLSNASWLKFLLIYPSAGIMFGFFAVFLIFMTGNPYSFGRFWARVGILITFFSGLQFSWQTLYSIMPAAAYINLASPLLYAFEGMRAAVLGQEGNINFWVCLGMVWLWIGIFGVLAHSYMKKRLDCV